MAKRKPRCPKCGAILRGVGDVLYCTNRKCDYEIAKKLLDEDPQK